MKRMKCYFKVKEGANMRIDDKEHRKLCTSYRSTPEAREKLEALKRLISDSLQTRVSTSQAIEIAVAEALERRVSQSA